MFSPHLSPFSTLFSPQSLSFLKDRFCRLKTSTERVVNPYLLVFGIKADTRLFSICCGSFIFLVLFILLFPLVLSMMMCDNKFETSENKM